jgi:cytochrome c oxidase subunit IV
MKTLGDRIWSFLKEGDKESTTRLVLIACTVTACVGIMIQAIMHTLTQDLLIGYAIFVSPSAVLKWLQKKEEVKSNG